MRSSPPFAYCPPDPQIEWRDDTPWSTRFNDGYYSSDDGLAETRHVFIAGNQLAQRWQSRPPGKPLKFVIAETGFGTGLNFVATWLMWRQFANVGDRLHYIATEAFPLAAADCRRALARWPELASLCDRLVSDWPPPVYGQHRLNFDDDGVTLDLLYGDSASCLQELLDGDGQVLAASDRDGVNAWYLDGFAPDRNPAQWCAELYQSVAQLSAADATCASFTAAGHVRRALSEAGFAIKKMSGFGRKRHMLSGILTTPATPRQENLPWHRPLATRPIDHAIVIGAGLAGCATAAALARRGIQVTVLDAAADCAAGGASAIPAALLYTRLSPAPGTMNRFTLTSFLHAQRHYQSHPGFTASGVLQLMHTPQLHEHFSQLKQQFADAGWLHFLSPEAASEIAGVDTAHPALHFPFAGSAHPQQICRDYLDAPLIELRTSTTVAAVTRDDSGWRVTCHSGDELTAPVVVIANAAAATTFAPTAWLPVRQIRGQVSLLQAANVPTPKLPVCHEGYVLPAAEGLYVGASFTPNDTTPGLLAAEHRSNIASLVRALPGFEAAEAAAIDDGFAAVRCSSPDYLPMVGGVPDVDAFASDYAALAHDAKRSIAKDGSYLPGLYLNIAHGSRGLSATPIAAELIAALVCGEPRPLPAPLCRALSPARFVIRGIKRGTAHQ